MTEAAKDAAPNAVGRPSELTEEVIKRALVYLCDGFLDVNQVVPTVAGLACYLGKSRNRMYEWAKISQEFRDILEGIATTQESLLVNGGLRGDFNAPVTKMMLTKHGYSDKIEQDVTSNGQTVGQAPTTIKLVIADDDSTD